MSDDNVVRALGRVEGRLDGLDKGLAANTKSIQDMGKRIGALEVSAARRGAWAGGFAGVGFALLTTALKQKLGL